jgi:hypothetical protein
MARHVFQRQSSFHSSILDFLSLMLQKGHIGWYSVKFVLHRGQYQAIGSHARTAAASMPFTLFQLIMK